MILIFNSFEEQIEKQQVKFVVTSYKEILTREEKIESRWIVSAFSMPSKCIITLPKKLIVFVGLESPYTEVCLIPVFRNTQAMNLDLLYLNFSFM